MTEHDCNYLIVGAGLAGAAAIVAAASGLTSGFIGLFWTIDTAPQQYKARGLSESLAPTFLPHIP